MCSLFAALQTDPIEGVFIQPDNDDFTRWFVWIEGPADCPLFAAQFFSQ